ncbi:DUF3168 domain-containing protein [Mesobacillus subterraneus]|uniref:DUF3168 domain-containing protein n=1 Tax=Mesobacillus subterraneus TaxID=285983 RepID=A0A427TDT6_9BACI|nr:DUF3168 domain-containing protein [Mesobacillus subterraneus]RSD21075.1 DUF3168 domain-containing protein [Mesobacillus subterraneus]
MDFEEALTAELTMIEGLANKVFPLNAKEGTLPPYIVYLSSEGLQDKTFDGYLLFKEVECEINILHSTYREMKDLTKVVLGKILSFQGRTIGEGGPRIQNLSYEKPFELYEKEIKQYRSVIDVKFKF